MQTENIKVTKLKLNPNNPRVIKDDKYNKLLKSIKDFPKMLQLRPIVVNDDMVVLGGNQRLKACKQAGFKEVPTIKASELTSDEQREFIIKDNVGFGENDWDMLANEWNADELEEWGMEMPDGWNQDEVLEAEGDDFYEEPPENPITQLGDLYEIGEHRLLCGDSTDSDQVAKLMNGLHWDLCATSPPYNQGNSCGNLLHTKGLGVGKKDVKLYDDKLQDNRSSDEYNKFCLDILNTTSLFKNSNLHTICWNVSYNAKSRDDYGKIVFSDFNPFNVKETIIWDKTHSINLPQVGIYSRKCEFVFVMSANEKYNTSQTYNDCRWNYWQIKSGGSQITGEDVEHRATYPIDFASKMITDFSLQNNTVYDPFLGSGTTMVSAQQLNRKCYGMELDTKYCDLIVRRMIKLDASLEIKRNGEQIRHQEFTAAEA